MNEIRPPFDLDSATNMIKLLDELWNSGDPQKLVQYCTADTTWRERTFLLTGRKALIDFFETEWSLKLNYSVKHDLWGFRENRMAALFECRWENSTGYRYLGYGTALMEFDESGLLTRRHASVNDSLVGSV